MYFPRDIDIAVRAWADQPSARKPLILRGARQTGKTAAVRALASRFDRFLEVNLERHADLRMVRACTSADDLLAALKVRHDLATLPPKTLLFLDEVQEHAPAIKWLRFLFEDHPGIAVVAAGSYLEVRLQERGFSFPVGRVTFSRVHPFTFLEFLRAVGRGVLADRIVAAVRAREPLRAVEHDEARHRFGEWLLVGGMPEAVARWVETGSPVAVRQVHADLAQAFAEDLKKYRGRSDLAYLEAAFDALPVHWGLRFKYESFAPGYRSALMKSALRKLEGAMVVHRVLPTSSLAPPIVPRPRSAPKLLPLDIGLACTELRVPFDALRTPHEQVLDGRLAEMAVGQLLLARGGAQHFWVSESAKASAEVDYLQAGRSGLVPVEVKAGASGSLKSLHQFLWRSGRRAGIRLHTGPIDDREHTVVMPDGTLGYRLVSLPLYAAELVPDVAEELFSSRR